MKLFIGCDPGASGAIAFYDADVDDLLALHDMPIDKVEIGGKERSRVADRALLTMLWFNGQSRGAKVFLEIPEARPLRGRNKQDGSIILRTPGAAGMLSLGMNYGALRMACIANMLSVQEVRPGAWKRSMGMTSSKDESRRIAADRFPQWARNFERKKDDGRAEAAMIAVWGSRQNGG